MTIPNTILRMAAVCARTGLTKPAVYALMKQGRFPLQVKLGSSMSVGWVEAEVQEWIEARIEERDRRGGNMAIEQKANMLNRAYGDPKLTSFASQNEAYEHTPPSLIRHRPGRA